MKYQQYFQEDWAHRNRPVDWSGVIATLAPAQFVAYSVRAVSDPRHRTNDVAWVKAVDLTPAPIDMALLGMRARFAYALANATVKK